MDPAAHGSGGRPVGGMAAHTNKEYVTWESSRWKDGSTYEGLIKDGKCHVRGVLRYANGDRYEGEYKDNYMDGLGVYIWKNGAIYRGEWRGNNMHGCGVKLVPGSEKGGSGITPQEGEWVDDHFVGDMLVCSKYTSRKRAMEADFAAASARALQLEHDSVLDEEESKKSASSGRGGPPRDDGGGPHLGGKTQHPQRPLALVSGGLSRWGLQLGGSRRHIPWITSLLGRRNR
mmetsp:Transcript_14478/g.36637  ORF Transcript_14478/g.36637 Transcript_14478/m.36637 type:complete len:231 (-) Transcript_14478:145-837(-)